MDDSSHETYEEAGSLAPMPAAADQEVGDELCQYDCENDADYRVQVETGEVLYCCQPCSNRNRIYAKENGLLKYEVTTPDSGGELDV